MKVLIVPAVAVREGEFVYPGEIQVVGYRAHVEEICHLDSLLECARGDLKQALKVSAYDEAKERELFAKWKAYPIPSLNSDGQFDKEYLQREWASWKACAKSRAGIQS